MNEEQNLPDNWNELRRVSRIDEPLREVHGRLLRWGQFIRNDRRYQSAWPSSTLLGRIIDLGVDGALAKSTGSSEDMPTLIQNVHKAVERLGVGEQLSAREYYLGYAPVETIAPQLRMTIRMFYNTLNDARREVRGYLRAVEQSWI